MFDLVKNSSTVHAVYADKGGILEGVNDISERCSAAEDSNRVSWQAESDAPVAWSKLLSYFSTCNCLLGITSGLNQEEVTA